MPSHLGDEDPMRHPRYTGIPTFMRTPHGQAYDDVDIGLVGVPFDNGVTNRPGARHGPREIRNQSTLMGLMNSATGVCPYALCKVSDLGDAFSHHPFHLEESLNDIQKFYAGIHAAGIVPVSAGGDHSVTLPILRAIAAERPLGLVQFDAHCDTGDGRAGSKFNHGTPFRRATEEGLIDPKRTVQIGIRGGLNNPDIWQFSYDAGMRVIRMEELYDLGVKAVVREARKIVGDGPTYVTFDVDGLDPVYAPGTGTPEVGGFSTLEAQLMLRGLQGLNLVGGDVVEVAPPFDPSGTTALVGATMMFEILCIVADSVSRRRAQT